MSISSGLEVVQNVVDYGPQILQQLSEIKSTLGSGSFGERIFTFLVSIVGAIIGGSFVIYANKMSHEHQIAREERNAKRAREEKAMREALEACNEFLQLATRLEQILQLMESDSARGAPESELKALEGKVKEIGFDGQIKQLRIITTCPQQIINASNAVQMAVWPVLQGSVGASSVEIKNSVVQAKSAFDQQMQTYFKDYLAKQIQPFPVENVNEHGGE